MPFFAAVLISAGFAFSINGGPISYAIAVMTAIIIVEFFITKYEYKLESEVFNTHNIVSQGPVFPALQTIKNGHLHYLTDPDYVCAYRWDSLTGFWEIVALFQYEEEADKPKEFAVPLMSDSDLALYTRLE